MNLELAYGADKINLNISDDVKVDHYSPSTVFDSSDAMNFLVQAQRHGLSKVLAAKSPLIVVNDGYRTTPTEKILDWLLMGYPSFLNNARFLIATGTHPEPTEEHLRSIFGKHLENVRSRLHIHDCHDRTTMSVAGVDHFGAMFYINKMVEASENVCVITSVEPHYFAGLTGGRKSLVPGLADFDTIARNHNLANSLDAAPLKIEGNPVAEHMSEMAGMAGASRIMSIQVVTDREGEIASTHVGALDKAFDEASEVACALYECSSDKPYDLFMCEVGPPFDNNLYQVQKALENCQTAVVDGGAAVLLSTCNEGVGSRSFFELADYWDSDSNEHKEGKTVFGSHKLSRVNAMSKRIDVRLKSELDDDTVRKVFYEPVADLQEYIDKKINDSTGHGRVAVVHDAANTVLTLS